MPREETELERGEYQVLENTTDSNEKNPSTTVITVWPSTEAFPVQLEFRPVSTRKAEKSSEYTISRIRQGTAQGFTPIESIYLFPARQHGLSSPSVCRTDAYDMIEAEMHARVAELRKAGDHTAADRLLARTSNDLMLLRETDACPGIENYSRYFSGRAEGEPPATLMDYWTHRFGSD